MSIDVVPELLENITKYYNSGIKTSLILSRVRKKIEAKTATYIDADTYAKEVARILSLAYEKHINDDTLPDGIFYYNIAKRVIEPTILAAIEEVDNTTAEIQEMLNQKAGIGLRVVRPQINHDRIDDIINRLSMEAQNVEELEE